TCIVDAAPVFKKLDDINELLILLIYTRDIFEAYFFLILVIELRFALAEVHHFAAASAAALCLTHQEQEEEEYEQERYECEQHACPWTLLFRRFNGEVQTILRFCSLQYLVKIFCAVVRNHRCKGFLLILAGQSPFDQIDVLLRLNCQLFYVTGVQLIEKLIVLQFFLEGGITIKTLKNTKHDH